MTIIFHSPGINVIEAHLFQSKIRDHIAKHTCCGVWPSASASWSRNSVDLGAGNQYGNVMATAADDAEARVCTALDPATKHAAV